MVLRTVQHTHQHFPAIFKAEVYFNSIKSCDIWYFILATAIHINAEVQYVSQLDIDWNWNARICERFSTYLPF